MNLNEIPLFAMLKGRFSHLGERQRLISQNVANSDTPGYTPNDLKAYSFEAQVRAAHTASGTVGSAARGQAVTPQPLQADQGQGFRDDARRQFRRARGGDAEDGRGADELRRGDQFLPEVPGHAAAGQPRAGPRLRKR